MPNLPLTVWLGGVQAPVIYQGRSGCCVGLDQVAFIVPAAVPSGCAVPLVVQIGTTASTISSTTALPVATGSPSCTPVNAALAGINVEQAVMAGPVSVGIVALDHSSDGTGGFEDDASFQFFQMQSYNPGSEPFFLSWVDDPPAGTCTVYDNLNLKSNVPISSRAALDGGSTVMLAGPAGSVQVPVNAKGDTFNPNGSFLVPGSYTISGSGGADVGAFTASATVLALPVLSSPSNNAVVTRANGMTVAWNGGSGIVQILVNAPTDANYSDGRAALCNASANSGTFTIPPYVLLTLPPNNPQTYSAGFVFSSVAKNPFAAAGLSAGIVQTTTNVAGSGYGWGSGGFILK